MHFNKIIGQSSIKEFLSQMADQERMPHAQIFLGPEGCGKLGLAMAFAQYVMCEDKKEGESCGECAPCRKATKMVHPDIHYSFPTVGTNVISTHLLPQWRTAVEENPYMSANQWFRFIGAENKQGNINKTECRAIVKKLSLKTFESTYKILIMWLPEYLGKEGNRLLKLIEEPPDNTLFILVTENQEQILNTILSRCQLVKIRSLADEEVISGLSELEGMNKEQATPIAHLANGNYNAALTMKDHNSDEQAELFLDWLRKCYKGNGVSLVSWVDKIATIGRENQKHFLKYALHFLREYMLLKVTGNRNVRLRESELTTAEKMTKVIELPQVGLISNLINDCSYEIERNANPKILFLDASIQMNKILKKEMVTHKG